MNQTVFVPLDWFLVYHYQRKLKYFNLKVNTVDIMLNAILNSKQWFCPQKSAMFKELVYLVNDEDDLSMEKLICPDLSKDDELNDLAVRAGLDIDPRRLGDLGVPRALPGVLVLDLGVKPKPKLRFKVEFVETTAAESIIYENKGSIKYSGIPGK